MSLQFTQDTQLAGFNSISLNQDAFTVTGRVKIDGTMAAERTLLSVHTTGNSVHEIYCNASGALWTVQTDFGATSTAMQSGATTQTQGEWYDIALVGVNASGNKIRAYIRPPGESLAREYVASNATSGTINHVYIGSPYPGYQALMTWSNAKVWSRALTKSEVETEFASQAVVDTTNRVAYAPLTGATINDVITSSFGAGGFAALAADDPSLTTYTLPVRSASEPSWAAPDFVVTTVSSPIALPDEAPASATAITVVQTAIAVTRATDAEAQWATLAAAPGYNNVIVAVLGGWTESPSAVTLEDSLGLTWTQRVATQYTPGGAGAHLVMWTAPVTKGGGQLRVRPVVTSTLNPSVTLAVLEVARANLSTLIDGTPVSNTGSSTSPSADHANTTNANDLMVAAVTYGSSLASVSSWGGSYTRADEKNGEAAVSVATRSVTSTGNYDPSATLDVSNPWVMGVMALREQAASTAPNITTTSLAPQVGGVAGSAQIAATGSGPITFTLSGAPPSVSITPGGLLAWLSTLATGSYAFDVVATNAAGSDTQSLTLTVSATPAAPAFSPRSGSTTVAQGSAVSITPTLANPGVPAATFSKASGPSWASVNASTGVITGTTVDAGIETVVVQAQNTLGIDLFTAQITVTAVLTAPSIVTTTLTTQTEAVPGTDQLVATGSSPIVFNVSVGSSLPSGVTLSTSGLLTYGPTVAPGSYSFGVTATNGVAPDASRTYSLTVNAAAEPPDPSGRWVRIDRDVQVWTRVPRDT